MEPYFNIIYGDSTYQDTYSGSSTTRFPAVYESLSGIASNPAGDRKTPNYQTFTKSAYFEMSGSVQQYSLDGSYFSRRDGIIPGFPGTDTSVSADSNTYNACLSKLYERIRGSADLAVDIAELNQTSAMMRKTIRGLTSFSTTLTRMRRMRPSDAVNAYLEWTYGWKPLANSIYETGKQLQRQLLQPQQSKLSITVQHSSYDRSTTVIDAGGQYQTVIRYEESQRVRMVTNWILGGSMTEAIASFSSLNPIAVAWELVPYSFVVDWAVDIGGYLRNLESAALYNSSFLNGYVTQTAMKTGKGELSGSSSDATFRYIYNGRNSGYTKIKIRSPMGAAPFPVIPSFNLDLSFDRLANATALAYQAISRLGR